MSLRLENASYTYALGRPYAVPALDGVTAEVGRGELVLVVGETGSGKSTLMRLAAGLLGVQQGTATIDGTPLTQEAARGRVGLIFQDPESQLFADTLLEDVMFGPRNLGMTPTEARKVAEKSLSEVGLDPAVYGGRSPFSLSGGEARRAAIAGVVAMRPRYLLADEPTAGLDARGRAAVRHLLIAEKERSSLVIVSHVAEEFLSDADRVVILKAGRVAWSGSGEDAVQDPGVFARSGLRAPDVLEVQRRASLAGRGLTGGYTLDPVLAAERLAGGER